jgi:hypothetical protein
VVHWFVMKPLYSCTVDSISLAFMVIKYTLVKSMLLDRRIPRLTKLSHLGFSNLRLGAHSHLSYFNQPDDISWRPSTNFATSHTPRTSNNDTTCSMAVVKRRTVARRLDYSRYFWVQHSGGCLLTATALGAALSRSKLATSNEHSQCTKI